MAIRMAKLSRSKAGDFVSRKGIPADVRDAYSRLYRDAARAPLRITKAGGAPVVPKVWEELFKRPSGMSPSAARVAWLEWCAEIDTRVAALRATAKGAGQPLTRLNAQALAGKWYGFFLEKHANDERPGSYWAKVRDHLVWEVIGREAPDEYKRDTDADPHWDWAKAPAVRNKVRPVIAEMALTASFLASAGMTLDEDAHKLFTDAVSDLLHQALCILEQRADGDHTPDETPKSFPAFNESAPTRVDGLSCWDLAVATKACYRGKSLAGNSPTISTLVLPERGVPSPAPSLTPCDIFDLRFAMGRCAPLILHRYLHYRHRGLASKPWEQQTPWS